MFLMITFFIMKTGFFYVRQFYQRLMLLNAACYKLMTPNTGTFGAINSKHTYCVT